MRSWLSCLVLVGCGVGAPSGDAGQGDRGPLAILGPSHAYAGASTCFELTASPSTSPLSFEWIFGDGTRETTTTPEACHAYASVGRVVVGVSVEIDGDLLTATLPVSVVFPLAEIAPQHSTPILTLGDRVYAVNPDADSVAVVDARALSRRAEQPTGRRPRTLARSGETLGVACQDDGTVRWLDLEGVERSRTALGRGTEPYGIVADPRGGGFFVSLRATGEVVALDMLGTVRARITVGSEPRGLAVFGDGLLLATRWRAGSEGAAVYAVDVREPALPRLIGTTVLPRQSGLDGDTDNNGVLSFLNQVVPSPDGRRAILPGVKANDVTGTFRNGAELTSQTTARAALGEVLHRGPAQLPSDSFRHSFDDLGFASAAVFSPQGDRLYVAFQGAQTVVAVDAFDFFGVGSIDGVGEAPQGLALSSDGRTLFVLAFLSRSVRAYDVSDLSREPPLLAEIGTVEEEPLAPTVLEGKRIFYRSRDPRMTRTRYLACASCHLDGEGDALVWDFTQRGEGLRNTIDLRGRDGRGPLHWTGNFDEVQDFEEDIRRHQGGVGFLSEALFAGAHGPALGTPKAGLSAELDALAAYVESLAEVGESPFAEDADALARGRRVFERAGCPRCHDGAALSDSRFDGEGRPILHDVGTSGPGSGARVGQPLAGFDTPSLRGLWRTAPYLHDGSAATLEEVIERAARDPMGRHGEASTLDASERDDLIAYLRAVE